MIIEIFLKIKNPLYQALFGGFLTWFLTLFGAIFIFFNKKPSKTIFSSMLSLAGGIMLAASFWSLLLPAKNIAEDLGINPFLNITLGLLSGSLFIFLLDRLIPHKHIQENQIKISQENSDTEIEGIKTNLKKTYLFILAVVLHNIPEGLAVGVAFGALINNINDINILVSAITLTIGIGLQNIPEGLAIALPLYANGFSKRKSFFYGQLSAIVEPVSALCGVIFVSIFKNILPFSMSFASGAMIYIIIEEVIPEFQKNKTNDIATLFFIAGFIIMTILDISLG
ncbi:MAG: ZIP family metal transporter [Spirochaetes bacterium]|nr:ZIP family metal transporter [Spirochaetota bacterium]